VFGESHRTGRHHDSVRATTDTKGKQVNIPALSIASMRKVLKFRAAGLRRTSEETAKSSRRRKWLAAVPEEFSFLSINFLPLRACAGHCSSSAAATPPIGTPELDQPANGPRQVVKVGTSYEIPTAPRRDPMENPAERIQTHKVTFPMETRTRNRIRFSRLTSSGLIKQCE